MRGEGIITGVFVVKVLLAFFLAGVDFGSSNLEGFGFKSWGI